MATRADKHPARRIEADSIGPADLAAMFDVTDLVGHFRLSRDRLDVPDGWIGLELAGWHFVHHPAIPVMPIFASGEPIGWIVGYPVTADGRLLETEWSLDGSSMEWGALERSLYSLGGRYVAVFLRGEGHRVYLDPDGSLGAVFCGDARIVASNPFLIPEAFRSPYRADLVEAFGILHRPNNFAFGLTPWGSVERLVTNHYLDLDTWVPVRHWPSGELVVAVDTDQLVAEIVETLTRNIGAIVEKGPVQMSLTAGYDSRMLLACSRQWLDRITFVTTVHPDRIGRIDINVARHIAMKMGLQHRVLPSQPASAREMNRWLFRSGFMVGEPRGRSEVRTYTQMDPALPYLMGYAGELGRAGVWEEGDDESSSGTVEELLRRRKIPALPEVVERGQEWMNGLPTRNLLTVLGLSHLEQTLNEWFTAYGTPDGGKYQFYPLVHRRIFEAMLRLPPEYRRRNQLPQDIIGSTWPELLAFPINDASGGVYGAYRRLRRFARRYVKEPLTRAA